MNKKWIDNFVNKTIKEKYEYYLTWYQTSYEFHPYTCKCGEVLSPVVIAAGNKKWEFLMKCHKCNYTQKLSFDEVKRIVALYLSRR